MGQAACPSLQSTHSPQSTHSTMASHKHVSMPLMPDDTSQIIENNEDTHTTHELSSKLANPSSQTPKPCIQLPEKRIAKHIYLHQSNKKKFKKSTKNHNSWSHGTYRRRQRKCDIARKKRKNRKKKQKQNGRKKKYLKTKTKHNNFTQKCTYKYKQRNRVFHQVSQHQL